MGAEIARGACFCGRVEFDIELPSKFVVHCHCSECRRAGGAPFVTWLGTWENKLRILRGESELRTYSHTPDSTRQFCGNCGSQLFFRCERWPSEVHVTRACLPDAIDRKPQAHVFYSHKAEWFDPAARVALLGGDDGTTPLA